MPVTKRIEKFCKNSSKVGVYHPDIDSRNLECNIFYVNFQTNIPPAGIDL